MTNPRYANGHRRRLLRTRVLREEHECGICGEPVDKTIPTPDPLSAEVDEIVPIAHGGSPVQRDNVQLVHRLCNQCKSTGTHRGFCILCQTAGGATADGSGTDSFGRAGLTPTAHPASPTSPGAPGSTTQVADLGDGPAPRAPRRSHGLAPLRPLGKKIGGSRDWSSTARRRRRATRNRRGLRRSGTGAQGRPARSVWCSWSRSSAWDPTLRAGEPACLPGDEARGIRLRPVCGRGR